MSHKYPVKFRVKSVVRDQLLEVAPDADLAIGPDLTKEMSRQPGHYAYYAALAEEEYRRGKRIKFKLHCLSEDLDAKFRKEAKDGGRKPTERELSNRIKRHPRMRALYDSYVKTMRRAGHLKVLKDAFEQRASMLQSIGANRRKSLDSEVRTLQDKVRSKLKQ